MADRDARPDGSRLVLAHRRVDVQNLNDAIRAARQARGELTGELVYQTSEGARAFAPGDRLLFRENNRELGVKNGMLGTVERTHAVGEVPGTGAAEEARLRIRLDSAKGPGLGRVVEVSMIALAVFVFVMTLLGAPVWLGELPFGWNAGAAAIVMRTDRWDAGLGLMQAVDPAGEQDAAYGLNLVRANQAALTACYDAAAKAGKDQLCTITVKAQ